MKAQQYAEAIFLASQNADEAKLEGIAKRVGDMLKEKGHVTLMPAIIRELEKLEQKRSTSTEVLVRLAKDADRDTFRSHIESDVELLGATSLPQKVEIDDTLVGGYEIKANGKRIDRTYKRSLLALYNNLIINNV